MGFPWESLGEEYLYQKEQYNSPSGRPASQGTILLPREWSQIPAWQDNHFPSKKKKNVLRVHED